MAAPTDTAAPARGARALRGALLAIAVAPAVVLALLVRRYAVNVPFWDQWDLVGLFEKQARGTLGVADLLAQHNEHRIVFPKLLFLALGRLSGWDVRYEMLASLLLACAVSASLYGLCRRTWAGETRPLAFWAFANLLLFSPLQHQNWLWGLQLTFLLPVACVAVGLRVSLSEAPPARRALVGLLLATVSTFSLGNGALAWLALAPALLRADAWAQATSRRRWALVWAAGALVNALVYLHGYRRPPANPTLAMALSEPVRLARFFLVVLGNPFAWGEDAARLTAAAALGAAELALFAACVAVVWRRGAAGRSSTVLAWTLLGAYALGAAAVVAVGRSPFGLDHALASRYVVLSTQFALALAALALASAGALGGHRVWAASARGALVLIFAGAVTQTLRAGAAGVGEMDMTYTRLSKSKGELLLSPLFPDAVLAPVLFPDADVPRRRAPILDALGLLHPRLARGRDLASFDAVRPQDSSRYGRIESVTRGDTGVFRAQGVALLPERPEPAHAVFLTAADTTGRASVVALASDGPARPGLAAALRCPACLVAGWQAEFPASALPAGASRIEAWALDARDGRCYRIAGGVDLTPAPGRD